MKPSLPPPDPHESLGMAPGEERPMPAPTAVYAAGPPGPETQRLSKQILDLRPGALIVVVRD